MFSLDSDRQKSEGIRDWRGTKHGTCSVGPFVLQ